MVRPLQRGERLPLTTLTPSTRLTLRAELPLGTSPDLRLFGLDETRRLRDDRYFVFYNQRSSPEGALSLSADGQAVHIDLERVPLAVHRLVLAATSDEHSFSTLGAGRVTLLVSDQPLLRLDLSGPMFSQERAVMLLELYRHQGQWRLAGVGQGFAGGLQALLESVGGEVAAPPAPVATSTPTPLLPAAACTAPAAPAAAWTPLVSAAGISAAGISAPGISAPLSAAGSRVCRRCGQSGGLMHRLNAQRLCRACARDLQSGLERFRVRFQAACADGVMELHEWADLQQTVLTERLEARAALTFVRPEAVRLLERTVAFARADGMMEDAEEMHIRRLRGLLDIPDALVSGLLRDVAELRQATAVRRGQLPSMRSVLILESGETAHLELPALYRHVTTARTREIQGRLTLTSRQLHFTTPSEGGWTVQYGKVLRIEELAQGVNLEVVPNRRHCRVLNSV